MNSTTGDFALISPDTGLPANLFAVGLALSRFTDQPLLSDPGHVSGIQPETFFRRGSQSYKGLLRNWNIDWCYFGVSELWPSLDWEAWRGAPTSSGPTSVFLVWEQGFDS